MLLSFSLNVDQCNCHFCGCWNCPLSSSDACICNSSSPVCSRIPLHRLCHLCQKPENFVVLKTLISQMVANENTCRKPCCHVLEDFCFRAMDCANNKFQSNIKRITELLFWSPEQPAPTSVQNTPLTPHSVTCSTWLKYSLPCAATRRQHRRCGLLWAKSKQEACGLNFCYVLHLSGIRFLFVYVCLHFIFLHFCRVLFLFCPQMCPTGLVFSCVHRWAGQTCFLPLSTLSSRTEHRTQA